ncbi:Protein O-mannosyl-transferase tmtc2, partial [Halocaridina rubra]
EHTTISSTGTTSYLPSSGDVGSSLPPPSPSPPVPFVVPSLNTTLSASSFHAINIILHSAVTASYVWLLKYAGVGPWTCLGAGSLFAVHPVHAEAVAGVVGRAELLAALAFCMALAAYLKYLRERAGSEKYWSGWQNNTCACWDENHSASFVKSLTDTVSLDSVPENTRWLKCLYIPSWAWLIVSVLATGVAVACKEQGVTALGVALLLHAAIVISNTPKYKSVFRALLHELWPGSLGIMVLLWSRISISSYSPTFTPADNPAAHSPSILTRTLSIGRAWAAHGRLIMWPSTLSFDWSMGAVPLVTTLWDSANLETLLLLVSLVSLAGRAFMGCAKERIDSCCRRSICNTYHSHSTYQDMLNNNFLRQGLTGSTYAKIDVTQNEYLEHHHLLPYHLQVVVAWVLLAVPFLPASNLVAYVGFMVAERILYLPSMGASLLVALGSQALWHYFRTKSYSSSKYIQYYFFSLGSCFEV